MYLLIPVLSIAYYSCTTDRSAYYVDFEKDTDGDGIMDHVEDLNGTSKNNPCDPMQNFGYNSYDPLNLLWGNSDCDGDGLNNEDELANGTDPYGDSLDTQFAIPEFLPKLSALKLFQGTISDLNLNPGVYEYSPSTPLFSDYAHKLRTVAVPVDEKIVYNGEGLPLFPDNTILTNTIYYTHDERNALLGKRIIETQVLIKKDGDWKVGNYIWNEIQTEAFLNDSAHTVPIEWIDINGNNRTVNYTVNSKIVCFQCHNINGGVQPIGFKTRMLNFTYNGINQLQYFINQGLLAETPDISQIAVLPDWSDPLLSLEERARAYLDVNCAHCHQPGGSYNNGIEDLFELRYETSFELSHIYEKRMEIHERMNTRILGYSMPLIGTTLIHNEGVELINEYIDSLK